MRIYNKNQFVQIKGFSLVELMIAMTIGLLVIAATLSIFISNKQTYTATDNISRVQENARTAFELISRDLREASGTPCDSGMGPGSIISVLNNPGDMWGNWLNTITGYEAGALAGSAAGTDALEIKTGSASLFDVTDHNAGAFAFTLNTSDPHDIVAGDIVMVCDFSRAAIFQVSGVVGNVVSHAAGGAAPGNSTGNLGEAGNQYTFDTDDHATTLGRITATQWFVGANGRGGRSLFRNTLRTTAGVAAMVANEEVAEGVRDMQITYLLTDPGSGAPALVYVNAATVAAALRWDDVSAVRIVMTIEGNDQVGTNGQRLNRNIVQTINLRNRNP